MNILITGGAGFIGSNLAKHLQSIGHNILVLDNFSAGSKENIKGISYIEMDVRNIDNLTHKADLVIHLAAINSLPYSFEYPQETFDVNIYGTHKVLEFCKKYKIPIIFAGSSAEYELTNIFPTPETEQNPHSPYAISKTIGGKLLEIFNESTGLPAVHCRFFSTYGPAQDYKRDIPPVVSTFMLNLINDKQSVLYLNGTKHRDYIYVQDVVDGIETIVSNINTFKYSIINIGTGKNISIENLYNLCAKIANKSIKPRRTNDDFWPDPTLITLADTHRLSALGWSSKVSLEKGLTMHYNWLKENLNESV